MAIKKVAEEDAGDFHFELHQKEDGKYTCVRSDVSDPTRQSEELTEVRDIPPNVFSLFNKLMY